jgi:hypothetical protein
MAAGFFMLGFAVLVFLGVGPAPRPPPPPPTTKRAWLYLVQT